MAFTSGEMWDIETNIPGGYNFTSNTLTPTGMSGPLTFTRNSTAVRVNSAGLSESVAVNVTRFTYDPVTKAPLGVLIEQASTNSLLWSEALDNAAWTAPSTNGAVTPNVTNDTFGNLTMDRLSSDGTNNRKKQSVAHTSGTSIYYGQVKVAKKAAAHTLEMSVMFEGGTTPVTTTVQIVTSTGVATRTLGTGEFGVIEFSNHWVLWAAVTDNASGNTSRGMQLLIPTSGQSADVGAMQLELSPLTSYVPTGATTMQRLGDVLTKPFTFSGAYSAVIEAVSAATFPADKIRRLLSIDDGTTNNRINLLIGGSGNLEVLVIRDGVAQANTVIGPAVTNSKIKIAFAIRNNDFAVIVTGGSIITDTTLQIPTALNTLRIGSYVNQQDSWSAPIASLREYPGVRLTNTELTSAVA